MFDLILGNVPGMRKVDEPDRNWENNKDAVEERNAHLGRIGEREESRREELCREGLREAQPQAPDVALAVMTRAAAKREAETTGLKVATIPRIDVTHMEFREKQKKDESLKACFQEVGKPFKKGRNRNIFGFIMHNGMLYRRCQFNSGREVQQLMVPKVFRKAILALGHESVMAGHQGAKNTLVRITEEFFWPGIQSEVKRYVKSCDVCQRTVPKGRVGRAPLGNMPMVDMPFRKVAIDIVGPIPPASYKGNRYVLTLVDMATRYPDAVALKKIDTIQVAEALLEMFSRYGVPKELVSDRGSNFTSELVSELNRLLSIEHKLTTPYHPMANGLVERFNGTLKTMVKRMCQERPKDWDRYLPAVLFAYREVPQTSLGFSPFEMVYGRAVRGPLTILRELWANEEIEAETKTTYTYVLELRERLEQTCKLAHESLRAAKQRDKEYYDRKTRERKLMPGDKALVLLPSDNNKLLMQWKGPFLVTRKKSEIDYELLVHNSKKVFHINMLKKYEEREAGVVDNVACMVVTEMRDGVEMQTYSAGKSMGIEKVIINADLSRRQALEIDEKLHRFHDIFSDLPGSTDVVECKLVCTTDQPIHVKQYPLPLAVQSAIEEEVEVMLRQGIIERSNSAYNAPLVVVKKQDGSNRVCVDFRRLNNVLVADAEPIPRIDVVFAKVASKKYFSKLDLAKGYWQIPLEESSKAKTAFSCSKGLFQFKFMPFGLKTAAAVFTKLMRRVLQGLKNVEHYIDDILVATDTWEEHLDALEQVFQRIRRAKLTVKPTKCEIGFQGVTFLGHKLGMGRITAKEGILEKIQAAAAPKTKKEMRSFLGLTGFYREFIPGYAEIAAPL